MKKLILILTAIFLLSSCGEKEEEIEIEIETTFIEEFEKKENILNEKEINNILTKEECIYLKKNYKTFDKSAEFFYKNGECLIKTIALNFDLENEFYLYRLDKEDLHDTKDEIEEEKIQEEKKEKEIEFMKNNKI